MLNFRAKNNTVVWFLAVFLLFFLVAIETRAFSFSKRMFSKEAIEYRLKGYKASQSKDYDEAIKYLQKASAMDPYYAAPHNDLGIIYEIKGWLERAEEEYLKALSVDPNNAEAVMNLGLLYESRQAYEKAIPYFQKRIELGPPESPWVKRAKALLSKYAPELYREITQKEEAKNLMYQALGEQHDGKLEISSYKEEAVRLQEREPELIIDAQVENYLKLEK
ncbi:MAG: tetratricopeptide repeat protein, partial [Candidatus Omnitrophica bacterium]|nr:tetratricopeptide repeat protein [Candidatus Omnitrophota bacterium]